MNTVLHWMTGTSAECTVCRGLCARGRLASPCLEPPPVSQRWSKFAPSLDDYFSVHLLFVTDAAVLVRCYQEQRCLLHQVRCPIRFHQIYVSFGTHRCYRRLGELFPVVLVRLVPCQVRYTPWSVSCFSGGAWGVFRVPGLRLVVKGLDVMTAGSTVYPRSCRIGFSAFPASISRIPWHRLRRRVCARSDCLLGESADCVN